MVVVSTTEEGSDPRLLFKLTYVLVVDDHPFLAGGLVGAQVLVNAPVAAPSAQDATAATARVEKKTATVKEMEGRRVRVIEWNQRRFNPGSNNSQCSN